MAKKNCKNEIDEHIVNALLKLKMPIIGKGGKKYVIRDEVRSETGLEHIANKQHRLKVRDIESVPLILKHPKIEMVDPYNKNYRNYYGIRKGIRNDMFIKIVTLPCLNDSNLEIIITIFPTNSIKFDSKKK